MSIGEEGIMGTLEFQLDELGREGFRALEQKGIAGGGRAVVPLSSTGAHIDVSIMDLVQS